MGYSAVIPSLPGLIKETMPKPDRFHIYSVEEIRAAVDEAHAAGLPVSVHALGGEAAGIIDRLKRAHRIGVKLVFGTDTVSDLPGKNRADMMLN
jgi:hypothetical protein